MELAIPFTLVGLWILTPSVRWPSQLCASAFPVYVLHAIFIKALSVAPFPYGPFAWIFEWIVVSFLALFAAFLLRRLSPRLTTVFFGGR